MALMADQGAFGEKPTAAIFADTGWEPKPVIDHLNYLKSKLSFPVYICKAGNLNEDILKATDSGKFVSVPFFTINEKGKKGMGRRQCTREYKITPIAAKIRELLGMKKYARFPKTEYVETWVGISTDEVFRVKESRFWWQKNRWFNSAGYEKETAAARSIDIQLDVEGYDKNSDEYYDLLNNRLHSIFPELNSVPSPSKTKVKSRQPVAPIPAGGSSYKGNRVRMTQDQLRMARELGITDEQSLKKYESEIKKQQRS
jgi:hypothetical protein